jgi:hypothetical protein
MSNGLRQLNLFTDHNETNLINIAYLIVERLFHLEVIEVHGGGCQLVEMAHILINGLEKLTFLTLDGFCHHGKIYDKQLRDLNNSNTRSFQTEIPNIMYGELLFVWL